MTDFEKRTKDEAAMIEEWPEPDDYVDDEEDDWDDDAPVARDYVVKFMVRGASAEQLDSINRYLFEAIAQELGIPYNNLEELEIEED